MKKSFLLVVVASIATVTIGAAIVSAQSLELQYPQLPGAQLSQKPLLPEFIRYLYVFSVLTTGFVAVGSAVYGGFRYMTSGGNTGAKSEARAQITGGVLGSLVILAGYLLLTTINPQLVIFNIAKPTTQISTVTTCNCYNPLTDQCKQDCTQKKLESSFLEIPTGTLVEKILDKKVLNEFESIAKQIEEKYAKDVKDRANDLKKELDQCQCSRTTVIPNCTTVGFACTALQCSGEPCNRAAVEQKKKALQDAMEKLSDYVEASIGDNISLAPGIGGGGKSIVITDSQDLCSVSRLQSVFGGKAEEASRICSVERSVDKFGFTDPWTINDGCKRGQYDYSVGPFQINLFRTQRCNLVGISESDVFEKINESTCRVINKPLADECAKRWGWGNFDLNAQKALGVYGDAGNTWCPWTASCPQYTNLCPAKRGCF